MSTLFCVPSGTVQCRSSKQVSVTLCVQRRATAQAAFFCGTAECFVYLSARNVQLAATAGTGKRPRLDEQVGALRKDRAPPVCAALGSAVCAFLVEFRVCRGLYLACCLRAFVAPL